MRYAFRPVLKNDLALLRDWRQEPHVRAWWDAGEPEEDDLKDVRVAQWIVSLDDRPFAFMQDYDVHGWAGHHFASLPAGSRGIDQFIGAPEMTGKGHGPAFITERVKALFADGVPVVATDPDPENARAIAAYKKVGFEVFGEAQATPWGRILPMRLNANATTA